MFFAKFAERTGLSDFLAPRGTPKKRDGAADSTSSETDAVDPERIKRSRLDAQKIAEEDAESKGLFAKKQRVRYTNKSDSSVCDAIICGVHFDDGPDRPYYTIKYKKQVEEELEDGSTKTNIVEIEKQTTPDRLVQVPWDEEVSWKVLQP